MKEVIKSIAIAVGAVILYYALSFLLSLGGSWFLMTMPWGLNRRFMTILLNVLIRLVILLVFVAWYLWQKPKKNRIPQYKRVFTVKNIFSFVGLAIFGQVITGFFVSLMTMFFPKEAIVYSSVVRSFSLNQTSPLFMILLVGVVGPMGEEFFFRGVLYEHLKRGIESWGAMIISALVFGIFHGNLIQGVYAALAGLLLAYIYEKSGTIWASIVVHICFNLSSYLIGYLSTFFEWIGFPLTGVRYIGFLAVSIVIFVLCIRQFTHSIQEEKESDYERISEI